MSQKTTLTKLLILLVLILTALPSCVKEKEVKNYESTNKTENSPFSYGSSSNAASVKLLTWNIQDLGRTKNNKEILQIARIIKHYDIIAIQEVVGKDPKGAQAVAKIVQKLNRMGSKWDYRISNPTKSSSLQASERYAFIWKTSAIKATGRPYLDDILQNKCEREPFIGKFKSTKSAKPFYIVNVHTVPSNKMPEREIFHFKDYQERLETDLVFICGDFNLNEEHTVWKDFYKKGFTPAIQNTKTTLKRSCKNGNYLNYRMDNIYFDTDVISKESANNVDFINSCRSLRRARTLSDHLPVFLEFSIL